jgi:hypothetical protein
MRRMIWLGAILGLSLTLVPANAEPYCQSKDADPNECLNGHYNVCLWNGRLTWAKSGYPVPSGRLSIMIIDEPVVAPPCSGSTDTQTVTFRR